MHQHLHQQRWLFQPPARTTATPQKSVGSTHCAAKDASPSSSTEKRPKGRDAAKASNKKASLSSEYVSKMHDLSVRKIELFKETEVERKARLHEMVALEKVKVEEAREHWKMMLELERERLAMEQKHLQMEAEKKEKEENERILAINLDQCQPMQRIYYQALQEDILQKMMS
ncbi:arginine and glutamate-rich protein 1-like [Panicum miliaceum]|uniref:Arginine and glutamate-rich protein 1-like n=1 Tax=Panicum miliaceum TaxID=4540 RepID=A0A3L6QRP4_PANMI|nr:arginine and glutamate-rich protein 1-like [Panicum miliaceum]